MPLIKKLSMLFILIIAGHCSLLAQKQVHLSVSYLPNHQYRQKADQIMHLDMKLPGGKKGAQKVESANMQTPTKTVATTHNESITTTGKLINDTLFPVQMAITKSVGANGQNVIPAGTMVYGNASTNGSIVFDSIVADGLDEKVKAKLFAMIKSLTAQVLVPDHTMKVGERFTHQMPLALPVGRVNLNIVITTTYKLKSISNGIAYFDITQVFSMNGEGMSAAFKVTGNGNGNMTYDIKNRYYTQYGLNAKLNMDMKIDGESMSMKMESSSSQTVDITAN